MSIPNEVEQLKKELELYKTDRFCQGGCLYYQYDKINQLKAKVEVLQRIIKEKDDEILNLTLQLGGVEKGKWSKWS